ncbi:MAG: HDOD domain-containing protein [Planctomycetota bacterium]
MNQTLLNEELARARTLIASATQSIFELRPFPAIAIRVSQSCSNPDTTTRELAEIVESDATFATKIMRVVNSSLFACTREITTIRQALVILGRRSVVELVMSIAAQRVFYTEDTTRQARLEIFEHSLACAVVGRSLVSFQQLSIDGGSAFLAGVVHDIGKLIFLDLAPNVYPRLLAAVDPSMSAAEAEQRLFGANHAMLGELLAKTWGLSTNITDVIGSHHNVDPSTTTPLTQTIQRANRLVKAWGLGQSEEPSFADDDLSWLSDSTEAIVDFRQRCTEKFDETRSAMLS